MQSKFSTGSFCFSTNELFDVNTQIRFSSQICFACSYPINHYFLGILSKLRKETLWNGLVAKISHLTGVLVCLNDMITKKIAMQKITHQLEHRFRTLYQQSYFCSKNYNKKVFSAVGTPDIQRIPSDLW